MSFQDYFPIWDQLQIQQQQRLLDSLSFQKVSRSTILHDGSTAGTGLYLIRTGQLRAYVFSDEGREITIYRLFERDMCLFSATCIIHLTSPSRRRRTPNSGSSPRRSTIA